MSYEQRRYVSPIDRSYRIPISPTRLRRARSPRTTGDLYLIHPLPDMLEPSYQRSRSPVRIESESPYKPYRPPIERIPIPPEDRRVRNPYYRQFAALPAPSEVKERQRSSSPPRRLFLTPLRD